MVRRIPESHQREDRIHHRGINRRQSFRTLEVSQHPLAGPAHGSLTSWLPWKSLVKLQGPVEREKGGSPEIATLSLWQRARSASPIERSLNGGFAREKFIETCMPRHRPT